MHDIAFMQELLHQYGYLVILGWTFLEGETIVIIAGFLAQKNLLNPWLVALCAFCGSFCSDQLMFSLGKYKGPGILRRFSRLESNSRKVRRLLKKYEIPLILGFRFIYGVRNITPILLGVSGVSRFKFFLLNMVGAGAWSLIFSFGGYYFGQIFSRYTAEVAYAELWLIGFILLIVALALLIRHIRHRREVCAALSIAGVELPAKMSRKARRLAEKTVMDARQAELEAAEDAREAAESSGKAAKYTDRTDK